MPIRDLEKAAGVATTATGGTVPIKDALRMAEHSHLWLCLFDDAGRPLYLGRTARLANAYQRLALYATSKGCTKPGCGVPASMTQVHHVNPWLQDGRTDIDNEDLACDADHGLIHDGPGGWATRIAGPDSDYPGRTEWLPPETLDPQRKPRVNLRHHVSELLRRSVEATRRRREG